MIKLETRNEIDLAKQGQIEGPCEYCEDVIVVGEYQNPPIPGGPFIIFICEACNDKQVERQSQNYWS